MSIWQFRDNGKASAQKERASSCGREAKSQKEVERVCNGDKKKEIWIND